MIEAKFTALTLIDLSFYKSIVSVICPILNETVYFTSKGYNHLIYNSNRKPRNIDEQFMKLKTLSEAPKLITKAAGIEETRTFKREIADKYGKRIVPVTLLALEYEVKRGYRVRVILEKSEFMENIIF